MNLSFVSWRRWHVGEQAGVPDHAGRPEGLGCSRLVRTSRPHTLLERRQQRLSHGSLLLSTCLHAVLMILSPAVMRTFSHFDKYYYIHRPTYIHPFNGPLSRTTWVSRYQKGKTNLDFTEARDSEWQWHQLGHMQPCTSLQTDNHTSTPPLSFLQAGCPSCRPTNSVEALKTDKYY